MRFVSENLGHKEIHGPIAIPEYTTELWKSSEFDLKLLEVTSGPKYGLKRVELSDLRRDDPDPALFEPPQGYKVQTIEYHQVPCGQQ